MGVIWGLGSGGILLVLGVILRCFLVGKSLFMEWCSCWYFVSILFDYLYLFCSLDWWVLVGSVGGQCEFGVVSIALFTWCFVVVCG